jgi:hypothetical protein
VVTFLDVFLDVAVPAADLRLRRRGKVVGDRSERIWRLLAREALDGVCWPQPLSEVQSAAAVLLQRRRQADPFGAAAPCGGGAVLVGWYGAQRCSGASSKARLVVVVVVMLASWKRSSRVRSFCRWHCVRLVLLSGAAPPVPD